jgi:site-specific DNA recombinase
MCSMNVKIRQSDDFRVAVYARVSSDQQAEAGTIASQLEELKDRMAKETLKLEKELTFVDDGYSGATLVRPALERLRDVAAAGAIDRVYIHSPDRLARKYAYQVLLIDELRRCGIEVVFLNHQLGQTPEDELLLQVQGMVAEYERAKILERSRRGKLHAARRGSVNVLGGAPYGYRYVSRQEGAGQASYEIVLEEARVVRQIFEWVGQDRFSIGEVRRRLQRNGIPTRTGKSYWDSATIWGVLKNPAYKGMAAYGKTRTGPMRPRLRTQRGDPDQPRRAVSTYAVPREQWHYIPVPAIVSEALFDSVQEQLVENKKRNRKGKRGVRHLLQGLLVCKKCGYAYYGKPISLSAGKGKRRSYAYYRCTGTDAYRFGGQRVCDNKQVRTDLLEEAVWQDVRLLLTDPQRVEKEYKRRLTDKKKHVGWNTTEQLHALIKKVKRGMARLVDAYQDGLIDKIEFEPRMRKAKERLGKLQAEAKRQTDEHAQQRELRQVIGHMKEFASNVKSNLKEADWMMRREIIRALVREIEVGQQAVRVVYRVAPPPFVQAPEKGRLQYCLRRAEPDVSQHFLALCFGPVV